MSSPFLLFLATWVAKKWYTVSFQKHESQTTAYVLHKSQVELYENKPLSPSPTGRLRRRCSGVTSTFWAAMTIFLFGSSNPGTEGGQTHHACLCSFPFPSPPLPSHLFSFSGIVSSLCDGRPVWKTSPSGCHWILSLCSKGFKVLQYSWEHQASRGCSKRTMGKDGKSVVQSSVGDLRRGSHLWRNQPAGKTI